MRMSFDMITSDNPYLDDNYDWHAHELAVRELLVAGFTLVPNWFPAGWPGYDYEIVGGIDALMRPAPRLFHRIRFKWLSRAVPKWGRRWRLRRTKELPF